MVEAQAVAMTEEQQQEQQPAATYDGQQEEESKVEITNGGRTAEDTPGVSTS